MKEVEMTTPLNVLDMMKLLKANGASDPKLLDAELRLLRDAPSYYLVWAKDKEKFLNEKASPSDA